VIMQLAIAVTLLLLHPFLALTQSLLNITTPSNHDHGPACVTSSSYSSPPKLDCLQSISQIPQTLGRLSLDNELSRLDKTTRRCRIYSEMLEGVKSDVVTPEMLYLGLYGIVMACEGSGLGAGKIGTGYAVVGVQRGIRIWVADADSPVKGLGANVDGNNGTNTLDAQLQEITQ
jgi:hypothetical protein